jgi:uncharacterized protein
MATHMHPTHPSRVFGAATDEQTLEELQRLELTVLEDGHISGLNGVLLGAAAESGMQGACLLGEMPHLFARFPFPTASLAVLKAFTVISDLDLDLTELAEQAEQMEHHLGEVLAQVEEAMERRTSPEEEAYLPEAPEEAPLSPADERRIDQLFERARQDRSTAFDLKQELDRLGVFTKYEDRFLDLFKKAD